MNRSPRSSSPLLAGQFHDNYCLCHGSVLSLDGAALPLQLDNLMHYSTASYADESWPRNGQTLANGSFLYRFAD